MKYDFSYRGGYINKQDSFSNVFFTKRFGNIETAKRWFDEYLKSITKDYYFVDNESIKITLEKTDINLLHKIYIRFNLRRWKKGFSEAKVKVDYLLPYLIRKVNERFKNIRLSSLVNYIGYLTK